MTHTASTLLRIHRIPASLRAAAVLSLLAACGSENEITAPLNPGPSDATGPASTPGPTSTPGLPSDGATATPTAPGQPSAPPAMTTPPPSTPTVPAEPAGPTATTVPVTTPPLVDPGTGGSANVDPPDPPATTQPPPTGDCTIPPPLGELIGWASMGTGTTGGGDLSPVIVTNAADFQAAVSGAAPAVVHLMGDITGSFDVGSNKTIVGICDASVTGHLGFSGVSNDIVRNLTVVGFNCSDSPDDCSGGEDAVGIRDGANHLWFDHLDVSDGSDGNLDTSAGADMITISWTRFSYSSLRTDPVQGASGHRFSNLIGGSDTDPLDVGRLNITFHHNWWADNIDQRMPRSRRGQIHMFNNLYTSSGNAYCTNAGFEARLLVQNNIYIGVNDPLDPNADGSMLAEGNVFLGTTGTMLGNGAGFVPPYTFSLDATDNLEQLIRNGAGPQ